MTPPHGTRSRYTAGCHCVVCVEANRIYCADRRAKRKAAITPDDPRHGTVTYYVNHGCRCLACCQAYIPINARTMARVKANREARR